MKHDPGLAELSRDHHQALYQAMRMKRATEDDLGDVREGVLAFWAEHGAKHFRIEEEILLPAFATSADPGDEAVVRVLVDHVRIRERMDRLTTNDIDLASLHELGDWLEGHVRHEERVLFPMIEAALEPDALEALGRRIAEAEAG